MLRLNIIAQNPSVVSLITSLGIVLLAFVALVILGLWVLVVVRRARRDEHDAGEEASDRGLEALRHSRLVVQPSGAASGSQPAVVAELEPIDEPEPSRR